MFFWNSTSLVSDNEKSMSYGNKVNMSDGGSDCAITRTLSGLGILTRGSENTETTYCSILQIKTRMTNG